MHDFSEASEFTATGGDITVEDIDGIQLGAVNLNVNTDGTITTNGGDLVLRSGGNVSQTEALVAPGTVDISARNAAGTDVFDVVLTNEDNDLSGEITILNAEDVSITNNAPGGTVLGVIVTSDNSTGSADVTINDGNDGDFQLTSSSGPVTQVTGTSITVSGSANIDAATNDVTLNEDNDFPDVGSGTALEIVGGSVSIKDIDSLRLGAVDVTALNAETLAGDLEVSDNIAADGGDIKLTSSDDINVVSDVEITNSTGDVSLLAMSLSLIHI